MGEFILKDQVAGKTAVSRRAILQGTGLLLGFALTGASTESVFAAPASQVVEYEVTGTFAPNGFIRINPTGTVTLVMPMAEMGQGVYTALSMLLAEELEVKLDQIQVEHAPANDALYANPFLHTIRERLLFCPLPRKKRDGDHHFPDGMAVGFRYNSHTEVTCRRLPRSK